MRAWSPKTEWTALLNGGPLLTLTPSDDDDMTCRWCGSPHVDTKERNGGFIHTCQACFAKWAT